MRLLRRYAGFLKADMWRASDPRIVVRKRRPGIGWTINLAGLRHRLARRR